MLRYFFSVVWPRNLAFHRHSFQTYSTSLQVKQEVVPANETQKPRKLRRPDIVRVGIYSNSLSPLDKVPQPSPWTALRDALRANKIDQATKIVETLKQRQQRPSHYVHYLILLEYYKSLNDTEMFEQIFNEVRQKKLLKRHIVLTALSHYTNGPNAEEKCEELLKYLEKMNYIFLNNNYVGDFSTLLKYANNTRNYQMVIFWYNKLKTINKFESHFSSGLVNSVIEAYLALYRYDEAKSVFYFFKSKKQDPSLLLKAFLQHYIEQVGNSPLRDILPTWTSNGEYYISSEMRVFFWKHLVRGGENAAYLGYNEFKEILNLSTKERLFLIRFFTERSQAEWALQLINEWNETPTEEELSVVRSILSSLAFSRVAESNDDHHTTTNSSNTYQNEDFDEYRRSDVESATASSLTVVTPLGYLYVPFRVRLQIFQALYAKAKSFGLGVSSRYYYGEACLKASVGDVEEAERLVMEAKSLNDDDTDRVLQNKVAATIANAYLERAINGKDVNKAQEAWKRLSAVRTPTTLEIIKYLQFFVNLGRPEDVCLEWQAFCSAHPNIKFERNIVSLLLHCGKMTKNFKFVEFLYSTKAITATDYLNAFIEEKDVSNALNAFRQIHAEYGHQVAPETLFELLYLIVSQQHSQEAILLVFETLKKYGGYITEEHYRILLEIALANNDLESAASLFGLMKKDGFLPSAFLYNRLLSLQLSMQKFNKVQK
jgi:hypothetical protein